MLLNHIKIATIFVRKEIFKVRNLSILGKILTEQYLKLLQIMVKDDFVLKTGFKRTF